MAKKTDQYEDGESWGLEPRRQPGRQPKREATVDKQLQQLITESSKWSRRAWDVWMAFDSLIPLAKDAHEITGLPELYDRAIAVTKEVIRSGRNLEKYLQEGKALAVKKSTGEGVTKKKKGKS